MKIIIVMGVCGSGKTSVAQELSRKLHYSFRDADEFHSEYNKQKMSKGIPLTDEDRLPWLLAMHSYLTSLLTSQTSGIVTCSALKKRYRSILVSGDSTQEVPMSDETITFVYLKGNFETLLSRLVQRSGHFMPPTLLQSQLDALEEPDDTENHITVSVDQTVADIVQYIIGQLSV
ncbi:unnamed protein product [Lymnaea stagnalis]|uniref:Gluconokinase n=1 Tax=Lymnaea stagnalis TaxID=6523 RepID=A0AAV2HMG9_LYMST